VAIARINNISIHDAHFSAVELGAILQVNNIEDILYIDRKETIKYQINQLYRC
jgi:hypothetical protein